MHNTAYQLTGSVGTPSSTLVEMIDNLKSVLHPPRVFVLNNGEWVDATWASWIQVDGHVSSVDLTRHWTTAYQSLS